jgi:Tol biopolymer transport system component
VFDSNQFRADPADQSTWVLTDMFVMDADGSNRTLLTRGNSATWSPDGKDIIFHASASYYASGGTETGTPVRDDPGAATTDSDLFMANVDDLAAAPDVLSKTQLATNITNTPTEIEDDADWSAANGLIAFTSRPAPGTETDFTQTEIYVMDPLHPELGRQQLTFNDYEERAVAWSPDGTRIAFSARIVEADSREGEICVINADGTGFQQLTSNTVPDLTVSWSPDGTQIAIQRNFSPFNWEIFTMDANPDGTFSNERQLTDTRGLNGGPLWGQVRTKVDSAVPGDPGDLGASPEIAADPFTADAHLLAGGSDQTVSEYVLGLVSDHGEHQGIGSAVSAFAHDQHGVTPGGPGGLHDGLADVALLGQYTAASFVGPAGAFGGTPTYDSPPAATLEQTLTQPLHS